MLNACALRFNVTGILKSFWFSRQTKQGSLTILLWTVVVWCTGVSCGGNDDAH